MSSSIKMSLFQKIHHHQTGLITNNNNDDINNFHHFKLEERNIPHTKIQATLDLHRFFEFGEKIGQGSFGVVICVVDKLNKNKNLAMKTVLKNNRERLKFIRREIQILKLIEHPHIVRLVKVYESPKKIYMIMEKCRQLAKVYKDQKQFSEMDSKKMIKELVEAVTYLHKYDIVHRDLKLENILLGQNPSDLFDEYYIKLSDFGLSIVKLGTGIDSMLNEFCGTLFYMAPELITKRSYSQQCDIWSIGVIMYMMVTGRFPFFSQDKRQLEKLICAGQLSGGKTIKGVSLEANDLIKMMLMLNPVDRIAATEILQHPWIQNKTISVADGETITNNHNILEVMKNWKDEMRVCKGGKESDWIMPANNTQLFQEKTMKNQLSNKHKNVEG